MPSAADTSTARFLIIGAGMSGLGMAIRLRQAGYRNITLLEKSQDVGGTWLENSYPNCGCDVPSFLYSFSFAPKPDWTEKYARQPEILQYFRECADRFRIREFIRFGTTVTGAAWNEESAVWQVTTAEGITLEAEFLVSAVGQLNRPRYPDIPGRDEFQGAQWHSARWNHSAELKDRRVAVIGNGASSIQFVPSVAQQASHLWLFQRSPSWIHPLHNYRYPRWAHWCFRKLPLAARLHRLWIFLMCEWRIIAFREGSLASRIYRNWLAHKMRKVLPPAMHSTLIPEYEPGCKRILLSSDYLQTVQRPNVTVVTAPIERLTRDTIVTSADSVAVDAVIYATGFEATELLQPLRILGQNGLALHDAWKDHPQALCGIMTPGFPNLFLLYGPNTNLGHNSIIYMVEHQVSYILKCLKRMRRQGSVTIEPRPEATQQYDAEVQRRLQDTVWAGACSSWYKKPDGSIPNNWHSSAAAYARMLRRPDYAALLFR